MPLKLTSRTKNVVRKCYSKRYSKRKGRKLAARANENGPLLVAVLLRSRLLATF